jgi:hypothetical protein
MAVMTGDRARGRSQKDQKFFASFFQKRSPCFPIRSVRQLSEQVTWSPNRGGWRKAARP